MMCCMVQVSLAEEVSTVEKDVPISKAGLRITHFEGASCYDQDQIYKHCVDQSQLFEIAKADVFFNRKDLLLIYGYDNCCWCRAIYKLFYKYQKFQDAFVIRTIAKDKHNGTGKRLIEKLRSDHGVTHYYIVPYLIRIDGKTGKVKEFIRPNSMEQNAESQGWCGYSSKKVMTKFFPVK